MAGERKKPTAAEKGKAVMVEEKKKDKGTERALNAVRAAQRSTALAIHDPPVAAAAEPRELRRSARIRSRPAPTGMAAPVVSRKRARTATPDIRGLLTALPSPPVADGKDFHELFSKALPSVVTVGFDKFHGSSMVTIYRTGFIIVAEEDYSLVLTTLSPDADGDAENRFVYLEGKRFQTKAYRIEQYKEENLLLLIVQTDKKHEAVNFSSDALGYEAIFTVCAMSGSKLNNKANAPLIEEMEASLGFFKGTVGNPSCFALDAASKHIVGSEKFFELGLCLHDDMITLKNVDAKRHTVEVAMAAPIFRLDGKMAGMVYSDGGWIDSKIGLLAEFIVLRLKTKYGVEWKESLKRVARGWLSDHSSL